MTDSHEGLSKLREPFAANKIGKLPKPTKRENKIDWCKECNSRHGLPAVHIDYVGHAAVTDRLLDADLEWEWEPFALDEDGLPKFDADGGLWIWLTVCGKKRIGYGDAQGKRGPDGVKEAIGDAIRNSGMRFGVALDLWHKGDLHGPSADPAPKPADPPPVDPALAARRALNATIQRLNISANDAAVRFAADNDGSHLGLSTDVAAIKALTKHYEDEAAKA
ncbi:hypothetical protein [Nocardia aurea]|uniref:hypothetical protein n=1 Tax=Nocardia aurea TaxID=2144174 RepID=UPI0033B3BEF6